MVKTIAKNFALNYLLALLVLASGSYIYDVGKKVYYANADISNFYTSSDLVAFDVYEGDEHQSIFSDRQVLGTNFGYAAEITKELNKVVDGERFGVYVEYGRPFVEQKPGNQIIQKIPIDLQPGEYEWTFYIKLDVYGAEREIIPPVKSNIFQVLPKPQEEVISITN